jgi:hypothetical protein
MQGLQVFIQSKIIANVLKDDGPAHLPWFVKLLVKIPGLNRIPGRIIGIGFQREHVSLVA